MSPKIFEANNSMLRARIGRDFRKGSFLEFTLDQNSTYEQWNYHDMQGYFLKGERSEKPGLKISAGIQYNLVGPTFAEIYLICRSQDNGPMFCIDEKCILSYRKLITKKA